MDVGSSPIRTLYRSPLAWILALTLGAWLASGYVFARLEHDPRFLAEPEWRRARGPGWGGPGVIMPALDRLEQLGPLNLFDPRFEAKIRGALAEVPGVARVIEIRRRWPRRYRVRVEMHKPAAVVVVQGRPVPVTADGIALPFAPYAETVGGLPLIVGVRKEPPPLGSVWRSERLRDGLATARQIGPHGDVIAALGLARIDVSGARDPLRGVNVLGEDGIHVRWGRPRQSVGENTVERKLEYLHIVATHVEQARDKEIDVRYGALYMRPIRSEDGSTP